MANNAGFAWINHLAGAVLAATEIATLPAANAIDLLGASIWRTPGVSGQWLTAAFDEPKSIRLLMVAAANLTSGAQWRLRLSSSAASRPCHRWTNSFRLTRAVKPDGRETEKGER